MTRASTTSHPSPLPGGERHLFRLMQALEDALIFRRARSMSPCIDCHQAPDGNRCDDHATDLTLITGYEQDLRDIQAAVARESAPGPYHRRHATSARQRIAPWFADVDLPWSACLVAVFDERLKPGRESFGVDEVDEVPVAGPFLDL